MSILSALFHGNSGAANSSVVAEQDAQAKEARDKETARQDRINRGLANIKAAFEGGKSYASPTTSAYTFAAPAAGSNVKSGDAVSGLPEGYTYVYTPAVAGTAGTAGTTAATSGIASGNYRGDSPGQNNKNAGYIAQTTYESPGNVNKSGGTAVSGTPGTPGKAAKWQVRGPDGTIYEVGASGEVTSSGAATDQTGFNDDFYNKYRQGYLDNLTPQVAQQYADAKDKLTYDLARAGTGRSSIAADEVAKLAEQNTLANANVQSTADTATGTLRNRVADERTKATSQLYATEDPDVATNTALAAVNNISLAQPESSTLGDVFKTALIGGANAMTGYKSQSFNNKVDAMLNKKGSSVVPS